MPNFIFVSTNHCNFHFSSSYMTECQRRPFSGRTPSTIARRPSTGSLNTFPDCFFGSVTNRIYDAFINGDYSKAVDEVHNLMKGREMPRRVKAFLLSCYFRLMEWDKCAKYSEGEGSHTEEWSLGPALAYSRHNKQIGGAGGADTLALIDAIVDGSLASAQIMLLEDNSLSNEERSLLESIICFLEGDIEKALNLDPGLNDYNKCLYRFMLGSLSPDEFPDLTDPIRSDFTELTNLNRVANGSWELPSKIKCDYTEFNRQLFLMLSDESAVEYLSKIYHTNSCLKNVAGANLLIFLCKTDQFDKASDLISESSSIRSVFRQQEDFILLDLLARSQSEARAQEAVHELRDRIAELCEKGGPIKELNGLTCVLTKYFFDHNLKNDMNELLQLTAEYLHDTDDWNMHLGHFHYISKNFRDACICYAKVIDKYESHPERLLQLPGVTLANFCVSLILTDQNERAETVMHKVEEAEAAILDDRVSRTSSLVINTVVGYLYCSKGNWEFGIERIMAAVDSAVPALDEETWFYCKQSFMQLLDALVVGSGPILSDDFIRLVEQFLAATIENHDATLIQTTGNTISYEAKRILRLFKKAVYE